MNEQIKPTTRPYFTAGELARALADIPEDTPIYVRGYEEGVNYATALVRAQVIPFAYSGAWYYGEHEVPYGKGDGRAIEEGYELAGTHIRDNGEEGA